VCFSTTPKWPFNGAHPVVVPAQVPGRYVVYASDGRVYDETGAAGALRHVLAELADRSAT